jgi:hypothetical protein
MSLRLAGQKECPSGKILSTSQEVKFKFGCGYEQAAYQPWRNNVKKTHGKVLNNPHWQYSRR